MTKFYVSVESKQNNSPAYESSSFECDSLTEAKEIAERASIGYYDNSIYIDRKAYLYFNDEQKQESFLLATFNMGEEI